MEADGRYLGTRKPWSSAMGTPTRMQQRAMAAMDGRRWLVIGGGECRRRFFTLQPPSLPPPNHGTCPGLK